MSDFYDMLAVYDVQMAKQFTQETKELEEKKQSFHKNHEARMNILNSAINDLQKLNNEIDDFRSNNEESFREINAMLDAL